MKFPWRKESITLRTSRLEVFCKKVFLKILQLSQENTLCQGLFLNKDAGLSPATLLKKRLWHRSFPVKFAKFLRTTFFIKHFWWLLLDTLRILSHPEYSSLAET